MILKFLPLEFIGGMFLALLAFLEAGRRIGLAAAKKTGKEPSSGPGGLEAAIYGLMGLLIAFTFSGAASRFEARRHLITQEANAVGTAYLRLDLLSAEAQPALKEKFRKYLDLRLEAYRKMPDIKATKEGLALAKNLQGEIWAEAVADCRKVLPVPAAQVLLPAINEMIDITTTRMVATMNHPPWIIYAMLVLLALVSAMLAGYGMGNEKRRFHKLAFAAILAVTVYVIIDLEFPRMGLIQIKAADKVLMEVREGMN
jgi:hypothetical protein